MKTFLRCFAVLLCALGLSALAAPQPILRNSWSTNAPGTPVRGVNNLSVTNSADKEWRFYGTGTSTVARLADVTNALLSLSGITNVPYSGFTNYGASRVTGTAYFGSDLLVAGDAYINSLQSSNAFFFPPAGGSVAGTFYSNVNVQGNISASNIVAGNGSFYGNGVGVTNIPSTSITGNGFVLTLNGNATNLAVSPAAYNLPVLSASNNALALAFSIKSNGFSTFLKGVASTNDILTTVLGTDAGLAGAQSTNGVAVGTLAGNAALNSNRGVFMGYLAGYQSSDFYNSVVIGYEAGRIGAGMYETVAVGYDAAYIGSNSREGVYIGYGSGMQSTNNIGNTSVGWRSGYQSSASPYSTFLGKEAGYQAYNSEGATWVGYQSGQTASGNINSAGLGYRAGYGVISGSNSVFAGFDAGQGSSGSHEAVVIGSEAGYTTITSPSAVLIGITAGYRAVESLQLVAIGKLSGSRIYRGTNSTFVGYTSGFESTNVWGTVGIGGFAGYRATGSFFSTFLGHGSGVRSTNSFYLTAAGANSGYEADLAHQSVFLGVSAGRTSRSASNSVFIGAWSGTNTTRANTLFIDGVGKGTNALIYGEFDTGLVRINTNLQVVAQVNAGSTTAAVNQPIGMFGFLNLFTQVNSAVMSLTFYTNIISFNNVTTNGFYANPAIGVLTNAVAGYYRISIDLTALGASNQHIEGCVLTNSVDSELIGFQKQYSNTQVRKAAQSATGIMYLPALTRVSFGIKSTNDTTAIVIAKANLTIGTP